MKKERKKRKQKRKSEIFVSLNSAWKENNSSSGHLSFEWGPPVVPEIFPPQDTPFMMAGARTDARLRADGRRITFTTLFFWFS